MSARIELLDNGYVELVESWGSDQAIIEAARMSTQKGFLGWGPFCKNCGSDELCSDGPEPMCNACGEVCPGENSGDEKLLAYLYNNQHSTPFEFGGLVIEVKAPIFVFREWHRHRTQSYNEMSARYAPLPDENYIPTVERLMMNSKKNKQAGTWDGAAELTESTARRFQREVEIMYVNQQKLYVDALDAGVPKELARIHLPVGRYSKMRASTCLRNWLAFLTLRMSPNAQWEIRQYANAVGRLVEEEFPRTWELFAK